MTDSDPAWTVRTVIRKTAVVILLMGLLASLVGPAAAQPGSPARVDPAALEGAVGTWSLLSDGGVAGSARYALYRFREVPRFMLYWRPIPEGDDATAAADLVGLVAGNGAAGWSGEPPEVTSYREHTVRTYPLGPAGGPRSGAVRVWSCGTSGRQFGAVWGSEAGVDLDPFWLTELAAVSQTVACHGPIRVGPALDLPLGEVALFRGLGTGFRVPAHWRWGVLSQGSTPFEGSVWALPVHGVAFLLARRRAAGSGGTNDLMMATFELIPVLLGRADRMVAVIPRSVEEGEGNAYAEGTFSIEDRDWEWVSGEYRFAARAFLAEAEEHILLMAWLSDTKLKGVPVSLEPPWTEIRMWLDRAIRGYHP